MPTLRKRIEIVIHSEKADSPGLLALLLYGVSTVYGAAQKIRATGHRHNLLQSKSLPCRVIAIGNITAGGTGKTPMTIYLARELQQSGKRVAVVSRGYKGAAEKGGGIVSDGQNVLMDAGRAGDEPLLIASRLKGIPVVVGKKKGHQPCPAGSRPALWKLSPFTERNFKRTPGRFSTCRRMHPDTLTTRRGSGNIRQQR
jgi:tetraacyldisaccharide 4'-kinase